MSSAIDSTQRVLDVVSQGLHALEKIGEIAKGAVAASGTQLDPMGAVATGAIATLEAIAGIVDAVRNGLGGTVSVDAVEAEIDRLLSGLAANDADADSDLDAKFPK